MVVVLILCSWAKRVSEQIEPIDFEGKNNKEG